tara:strand:+ start:1421 stop:1768 length:348 start_codon:yes stop_codon:yes gene_type:complete
LLQLLFYFKNIFLENFRLGDRSFYFLLQNIFLFQQGIDFVLILDNLITDLMAFMIANYTLGTNINLIVFAKVFGLLLRMFQTELLHGVFFWLVWNSLIFHDHVLLAILTTKNIVW